MPVIEPIAGSAHTAVDQHRRPSTETMTPHGRGFVCMVAYTVYAFDARVRREAETLAANGFHVRCLTTKTGRLPKRYMLNGVEVQEVNVPKYRGKSTLAYAVSYSRFLLATSLVCLSLLKRDELDIVHAHNLPDFLVFAGLFPRLMGRKVVLDIHDSVPETFATKFSRAPFLWKALCFEERCSALLAHRVICVNHPQRDALVARGIPGEKTFISMNVPDPKIFSVSPRSAQSAEQPAHFNLVYHGTMATRLGVDLVIRAVAQLQKRIPDLRLHLWGDGDDLPAFQSLAHELKIDDKVFFRPEGVPLKDLPDQLRVMHVGVVGNRRSAAGDLMLPVKLLEYVHLGIPTIVPRLKTIVYYFSDDMVLFYEPEDVESLAAAIDRLYCEAELRDEQVKGAQAFITQYGWDRQGPELVAMYRELVGERESVKIS
jgi:glycosyltransferase involved in cell wall biosynthesis